jgi:hypothetical protein
VPRRCNDPASPNADSSSLTPTSPGR